LLVLAACRSRSSGWVTLSRFCARGGLFWCAFSLVATLRPIASTAGFPVLLGDFPANMMRSDFSRLFIGGYRSSPSRRRPVPLQAAPSPARFAVLISVERRAVASTSCPSDVVHRERGGPWWSLKVHSAWDSDFGTPTSEGFDRRPRRIENQSATLGFDSCVRICS
jgi:hypothetical protein